jgi:hypothetical protein
MGKHQTLEEQVGLEFRFSFGKPRFPGQAVDDIRSEGIVKFFR